MATSRLLRLTSGLIALAVVAVVAPAVRIARGLMDVHLASDFALIELSVMEAARGRQWAGPYSRFGWQHPGPGYFYALAPFHLAAGGNSASLAVGALVLNWLALVGVVIVLWRWAEGAASLWLALPLALGFGGYLGPGFVYSIWNPSVTVLPFVAFLLLCAGLAAGRAWALPGIVGAGSFLVTHVGYLPCVVVGAGASVALWLAGRRRRAHAAASLFGPLVLAAATAALFWTLPLLEQIAHQPGNLTRIARFFMARRDGHGVAEALAVVARETAWFCSYAWSGHRQQYDPLPALGGVALAIVGVIAAAQVSLLALWSLRLRERPFARSLAGVCLLCTLAAVPAVMRISGEVRPYLTTWVAALGVVSTNAALTPLLDRMLAARHRAAAAVVLAAGLALAFFLVGRHATGESQFPPAPAVAAAVHEQLNQAGRRRPFVRIQNRAPDVFFGAAAVLLQLEKRGVGFAVDRPWRGFFPERWWPTGGEDATLEFTARDSTAPRAPAFCTGQAPRDLCAVTMPTAP
jgi:hypothetical protein